MSEDMDRQIEEYYANNPPYEEEPSRLTIEIPLVGFTSEKLDNLFKLIYKIRYVSL